MINLFFTLIIIYLIKFYSYFTFKFKFSLKLIISMLLMTVS